MSAPDVSVFPHAKDPDNVTDVPLSDVVDRVRGPGLEAISSEIRAKYADGGKSAIKGLKENLPGVTFAGTFDRRAKASWRTPSGLVSFDLDALTPEQLATAWALLTDSPWVVIVYRSPSGCGLKGAVLVAGIRDEDSYLAAWHAVTAWLLSLGLVNDSQCKDSSRLAFLAHDPQCHYNTDAMFFDVAAWAVAPAPAPASAPAPVVSSPDAEARALAYVRTIPSVEGGGLGNPGLMNTCRALERFGLDRSAKRRVIDRWNQTNAQPPWSDKELDRALNTVESTPSTSPPLLRSENRHATTDTTPWPMLEPLGRASDPPPFDCATMLPGDVPWLLSFVEVVADAVQVPQDLVASASVGLVSLACARSVEVACAPEWREPAPLWLVALLRPGERKSASMAILARPFHEWMATERQTMAEPVARYLERRRVMEARLSALRTKAAKETKADARTRLESEAIDLAADLEAMPARVGVPELLVQSFTPEGLRDAMEANGEKLGIVSAEADAGELLGARYSDAGPNLDLMLCAHAGDPITTRRAGGRTVPLERPALGMVLAVQPEAVRTVLNDRAAKGRGLVDRMLLIHPPSRMGSRMLDPPAIGPDLTRWWSESLHAILSQPWPGRVIIGHDGVPVRCTSEPRILSIDPAARDILWGVRATLEPRLGEGGDLANVSGFASKLPGACARLALAFTMLRDPNAEVVGREAMRAACAWAPYLLAHHRAVLGDAVEPTERHHGRRLWRALQRRGRSVMTARDLFRLVEDSALPDMEAFTPVLRLLVDHGALRRLPPDPAAQGRPAERFAVHPGLLPGKLSDISDRSRCTGVVLSDMSDNSGGQEGAA